MPKFRPKGRGSPTSERQSAGGQLKGKRLPAVLDSVQASGFRLFMDLGFWEQDVRVDMMDASAGCSR